MNARLVRVLLPLLIAAPAAAQIVFAPPLPHPLTHPSIGVLAGDLDLDGKLDFVALPPQPGPFEASSFSALLGDGDGGLAAPVSHLLAGTAAGEGQIVDLGGENGTGAPDGKPDLLVGAVPFTPNNGLGWIGGKADGSFGGGTGTSLTLSTTDTYALDIDGDGDRDIVALAGGSPPFLPGTLTALIALSQGGYQIKGSGSTQFGTRFLALTDWNGDGKLEGTCNNSTSGTLSLFPADPTGGFLAPTHMALGGNPQELQASDLDLDGVQDLLVANSGLLGVQFLAGEADGSPGAPQLNPVAGAPVRLVLGDLDGDGLLDALSSGNGGDVLVLRGAGDGTLAQVATLSGAGAAQGLVLGDADDDGDLDAGVARAGTPGRVDLLLNATYPAGSAFTDLGHALPGTPGFPILIADGSLVAGQPFAFDLLNVKPLAATFAFVGLSAGYLPYKGGTLVPMPDLIVFGLVTDALGRLQLAGAWPAGASGVTFYLQFWTYDEAGVKGKSASNALQAQVP
jgi:FG-GAP-like repeat